MFAKTYSELTNSTNQYLENCLNQLIITPCDENSGGDLQLGFLAYYTYLSAARSPVAAAPIQASLRRTWRNVRRQRSSFWTAHYLALSNATDEQAVSDLIWNLHTWPLELIGAPFWEQFCTNHDHFAKTGLGTNIGRLQKKGGFFADYAVNNSQRLDIVLNREADRFGQPLTTRVLPANERRQGVYGRWDNMPTELADGGTGAWENSPGDWLLPYWMARFHGVLA
jgi:hypothetical protein